MAMIESHWGGVPHPGTRWRCFHMPMYTIYVGKYCVDVLQGSGIRRSWCPFLAHKTFPVASQSLSHVQEMISHLIDPLTGKVRVRLREEGTARVWGWSNFTHFPSFQGTHFQILEFHQLFHRNGLQPGVHSEPSRAGVYRDVLSFLPDEQVLAVYPEKVPWWFWWWRQGWRWRLGKPFDRF